MTLSKLNPYIKFFALTNHYTFQRFKNIIWFRWVNRWNENTHITHFGKLVNWLRRIWIRTVNQLLKYCTENYNFSLFKRPRPQFKTFLCIGCSLLQEPNISCVSTRVGRNGMTFVSRSNQFILISILLTLCPDYQPVPSRLEKAGIRDKYVMHVRPGP